MSSIKLKFEDFKLETIDQIKGGQNKQPKTESNCTEGDEGCCDEYHIDDDCYCC